MRLAPKGIQTMSEASASEALDLQQLTGHRLGPYKSFNPVNRVQIWQWCSAMGEKNPLYKDSGIAPPAMMQMWTMRDINDDYAPGSTDAAPYKVLDTLKQAGYPGNVAVSYDIEFFRYLHEGERTEHFTTVVAISDKKNTALGEGYFVTEQVDYTTDEQKPYAKALITYFQYKSKAEATTVDTTHETTDSTSISAQPSADHWQPDYQTLSSEQLTIGQALPEQVIPITHRLIVGGAIATQDFVDVHHNVPVAQAAAMPDIFMNILTTCGLCGRYLGAWAGIDSRLKKLQFNLMAPNLPGDTMTLQGQVTTIDADKTGALVNVAFSGNNSRGMHVSGKATVELPQ